MILRNRQSRGSGLLRSGIRYVPALVGIAVLLAALLGQVVQPSARAHDGAPGNLTAEVVEGGIALSWEPPLGEEPAGYRILRRHASGWEGLSVLVEDTGSAAARYTDTDILPDTGYVYRVQPLGGDGAGPRSNFVQMASPPGGSIESGPPPQRPPQDQSVTAREWSLLRGTDTTGTSGLVFTDNTFWVASGPQIHAFDKSGNTVTYNDTKDFQLSGFVEAWGAATDGSTLWIAESDTDDLKAYVLVAGAGQTRGDAVSSKDIDLYDLPGVGEAYYAITTDGTTMWACTDDEFVCHGHVLDPGVGQTFGEHLPEKAIRVDVSSIFDPRGAETDGTTLWLNSGSGADDKKLFAFAVAADGGEDYGVRTEYRDVTLDAAQNSADLAGVTIADGHMFVANHVPSGGSAADNKVYAYAKPDINDNAILRDVKVDGVSIPGFYGDAATLHYGVNSDTTEVTLEVTARASGATLAYNPAADANTSKAGRQVSLSEGANEVVITVTNGSATRNVTLSINRAVGTIGGWGADQDIDTLKKWRIGNPRAFFKSGTDFYVAEGSTSSHLNRISNEGAWEYARNIFATAQDAWTDGTTVWVLNVTEGQLRAYSLGTLARDATKEFNITAGTSFPRGLWSDGTTMWVSDQGSDTLKAYDFSSKNRASSKDFETLNTATNNDPGAIWSDGTTMWVVDTVDDKLYAYKMSDKSRDSDKDIDLITANSSPSGLWGGGGVIWVADTSDEKVYAYNTQVRSNSPATGTPTITAPNVFRVPAALSVDLSTVNDPNGVDSPTGVTYKWQRFDSTGTTLESDSIGTGATYTLTDSDAGKTLKVVVSYTDDDGFAEGPLTSAATAQITAAAACAAPTYVGGATQIWTAKVGVEEDLDENFSFYGYISTQQGGVGSLSDDTFTADSAYTIDLVGYEVNNNMPNGVVFWLRGSTGLTATERAQLALHVCNDETLTFSSSTYDNQGNVQIYHWADADTDLSGHAERTLYMSRDEAKPSFDSAQGLGTALKINFNEPLGAAASLANSAFSGKRTPSGGTETDLAFTGSPSISGNSVTLTLTSASSILATDTNVKITYTKPSSGSNNKIVDLFGNEADTKQNQPVVLDETAPELSTTTTPTLAADGLTLTVTYNEAMDTSALPASSAFTVEATPSGGTETTYALASSTPVSISGSAVTLNLAAPIPHSDTGVKVTYAKPQSGMVLQDLAGNDAAGFTDQSVTNNSEVPRVSIVAVHADASPGIADPVFRVTRSNTGSSALKVKISLTQSDSYFSNTDKEITIGANQTSATSPGSVFQSTYIGNTSGTLTATVAGGEDHAPALSPDDSADVQFKVPATGHTIKLIPESGVMFTFTEGAGTHITVPLGFVTGEGVAAPRESIKFNYASDNSGNATINDDYTHVAASLTVNPSDYAPFGSAYRADASRRIRIIDDTEHEVAETFGFVFSRFPGETGALKILANCPAEAQSGSECEIGITILDNDPLVVSGVEVTSDVPTAGYYDAGGAIQFTVTFNGKVAVTGTPQFSFVLGDTTRQANYASGSGTADIVFSYTVVAAENDFDGVSWAADSLALNGGTIKFDHSDVAEQVDADLSHDAQDAVTAHKVDTENPSLEKALAAGTVVLLDYSEELDTTAPAASAFSVSVDGGAGTSPSSVSIAGSRVTLTMGSAVSATNTTISYTKPGSNPIKDLVGKEADGFTNKTAEPGFTPPEFDEGATATRSIAEDASGGASVGTPVGATDADGDTDFAYWVSATTETDGQADLRAFNDKFEVAGATGQVSLKSGASLDYESRSSYSVLVNVTDKEDAAGNSEGSTLADYTTDDTLTLTVSVTNVDEPGRVEISGAALAGSTLTASVSDPDGSVSVQTWRWASSSSQTSGFTDIAGETTSTYEVQVGDRGNYLRASATYTDGHGSGKTRSGTTQTPVQVNATNSDATFGSRSGMQSVTVRENATSGTVGTFRATDADGDPVACELSGEDLDEFRRDFSWNCSTGALTVNSDAKIDFETRRTYSVQLKARDGKNLISQSDTEVDDTVELTVNVENRDDPGVVSFDEPPAVAIPVTASLSDQDGVVSVQSWQWARSSRQTGGFGNISAAHGGNRATYTPRESDVNMWLRASVRYTDGVGAGRSASGVHSPATAALPPPPEDPQRWVPVSFVDGSYVVEEGGSVTVRLRLDEVILRRPYSVPISVVHGGGASAADYSGMPEEVVFSRGVRETSFVLRALDDDADDNGEYLELSLDPIPAGLRGGTWVSTRISLEDSFGDVPNSTLSFDRATASADENESVTVNLRLDPPRDLTEHSNWAVVVSRDWSSTGVAASGSSRGSVSGPDFVFRGGKPRTMPMTVWCGGDAIDGPDHEISVWISETEILNSRDNRRYPLPLNTGAGSNHRFTLTCADDDDVQGQVSMDVGSRGPGYRPWESSGPSVVNVRLDRNAARDITIPIETTHHNGLTSADYTGVPQSVTIREGDTVASFEVWAIDDNEDEGREWLEVRLGTLPAGLSVKAGTSWTRISGDLPRSSVALEIIDDDDTPVQPVQGPNNAVVWIGDTATTVDEGGSVAVTIRLKRYGSANNRIVVPLVYTRGGGASSADYGSNPNGSGSPPTSLTFEPGQGTHKFRIVAVDDGSSESNETITIDFGSLPSGVRESVTDTTTITIRIVDND